MPLFKINTNINIVDANPIAQQATQLIANVLGKPESYVMVAINQNLTLTFAGTSEPCAFLELKSLGLDELNTTLYSEKLCQFIKNQLNIETTRIYIEFSNPARHLWGWDNKTF